MPVFSVIIPLYNKENFIENTLKSVLNQDFQNFEIVVIDDGSTDKSAEKVKTLNNPKINYFKIENQGVSTARNIGISKAKGKFICFLDADDYWYPHFLSEIHKHIELLPEQKVFACAIEFEINNKTIPSVYSIEKTGDYQLVDYFTSSLKQSVLWTSSSVFEKSVFEKSGVFNPNYKSGQDVDLWVRIGLNFPIVFIWKIGAKYVYDRQSLSRNWVKISERACFFEYISVEKNNKSLKKFLDYNRFSLVVKSKILRDKHSVLTFKNQIDPSNLSLKKIILLKMPRFVLSFLIQLKKQLVFVGIGKSQFK